MGGPDNDRAWYLIYAKPRQERLARENLERQGYEVFLPLVRSRKRRNNRRVELVEALFPRYLFIHLSATSDNWKPLRSTFGVLDLVRFGGQPAQVPEDLVAFLRRQADAAGVRDLAEVELKPGDRVRIVDGVFSGYGGILEAKGARERVVLLLSIAGKDARIEIDAGQLERDGSPVR